MVKEAINAFRTIKSETNVIGRMVNNLPKGKENTFNEKKVKNGQFIEEDSHEYDKISSFSEKNSGENIGLKKIERYSKIEENNSVGVLVLPNVINENELSDSNPSSYDNEIRVKRKRKFKTQLKNLKILPNRSYDFEN